MQERELRRALDRIDCNRTFTELDFAAIDLVYCFYPGIKDHSDIAQLFAIGGMTLIMDLYPHAKEVSGIKRPWYEILKEQEVE